MTSFPIKLPRDRLTETTVSTPHRVYPTGTLNQIRESFTVSVAFFEAHLIGGSQLVKPGFPGAGQVWFQILQL